MNRSKQLNAANYGRADTGGVGRGVVLRSLRQILVAIVLVLGGSIATNAAESVTDLEYFSLILPVGYTDSPRKGIDSRVGEILIKGKAFMIHYDTYGWGQEAKKFSEFSKEMLDSVIYYERLQSEPFETGIVVWSNSTDPHKLIVTLTVFDFGADLSVETSSKTQMHEAIAALRILKVTKPEGVKTTTRPEVRSFTVMPFGEAALLRKTGPQKGDRALADVTGASFVEFTIAQGSGLDGFNAIRVFSDGRGYAVVGFDDSRGARIPIQLSSQQRDLLLGAIQRDRIHRIEGMYSSGAADGVQGFVELVSTHGRVFSWLDNYFTPVSHTYAFSNEHIWPLVRTRLSPRHVKNLDLQEEYHRVFHKASGGR